MQQWQRTPTAVRVREWCPTTWVPVLQTRLLRPVALLFLYGPLPADTVLRQWLVNGASRAHLKPR